MSEYLRQDEIYAALSGNAALASAVTGIFEVPPPKQASPYIVLGGAQESSGERMNGQQSEITLTLHIWSDKWKTKKECYRIRDLILRALPDWVQLDGFSAELDDEEESEKWTHGELDIRYYDRR